LINPIIHTQKFFLPSLFLILLSFLSSITLLTLITSPSYYTSLSSHLPLTPLIPHPSSHISLTLLILISHLSSLIILISHHPSPITHHPSPITLITLISHLYYHSSLLSLSPFSSLITHSFYHLSHSLYSSHTSFINSSNPDPSSLTITIPLHSHSP
jgi:hypothetical protein